MHHSAGRMHNRPPEFKSRPRLRSRVPQGEQADKWRDLEYAAGRWCSLAHRRRRALQMAQRGDLCDHRWGPAPAREDLKQAEVELVFQVSELIWSAPHD